MSGNFSLTGKVGYLIGTEPLLWWEVKPKIWLQQDNVNIPLVILPIL